MKTKTIVLPSGKEIHLDCDLVPHPTTSRFISYDNGPIGNMIGREVVELSKVYRPPHGDGKNTVREIVSGTDQTNVDKLASYIEVKGCLHSELPPVLFKYKQARIENGIVYDYEVGPAGEHRFDAFEQVGATHWIFDIYDPIDSTFDREDAALFDNGSEAPSLGMTERAIKNLIGKHLEAGRWADSDDKLTDIKEYLKHNVPGMHPSARHQIAKTVLNSTGYTDFLELSPEKAEEWITSNTDLKTGGEVDWKREKAGYLLTDTYFDKRAYQAILKWGVENRESYFTVYTRTPKKGKTTDDKRNLMIGTLDKFFRCLDKVYEYKEEHGHYPFGIEQFIPQDRKGQEDFTRVIPVSDVPKPATLPVDQVK